ncbi:MAG: hypothetical protein ABSG84_02270 [Acidobacteriaceae bacterium]|jgi:hypothetical protein
MREPNCVSYLVLTFALCASAPFAQTKKPATPPKPSAQVLFVGCKSDGQVGPLDAPSGTTKAVSVSPELAQQLAYYQAEDGIGVLAPRGWNCFSTYGSNGSSLFVAPELITSEIVFSDNWKSFDGPAIQVSVSEGGTLGRFEVAEIIARIFPAYRSFVRRVIAEGIEPASDFPFGPYPNDKLTYKNNKIVEYQTPPDTDGLGTRSRLQKNASPISGVAILEGVDTNLIQLSSRLPPALDNAAPAIIHQVEREAAQLDRLDR